MSKERRIPLFFKWIFCAFMAFYFPAYFIGYGPQNFLWLSSIILMLTFLATLFESGFLASMAASGGLLFEVLWTVDFLFTVTALLIGSNVTGFTIYMFNPSLSIWLRVIAVFHLALPPLLIWLILRLGYDSRAWIVQMVLSWVLVLITWLITNPVLNINFVFSNVKFEQVNISSAQILMILFITAIVVCGGTHLFLRALHKRYSR